MVRVLNNSPGHMEGGQGSEREAQGTPAAAGSGEHQLRRQGMLQLACMRAKEHQPHASVLKGAYTGYLPHSRKPRTVGKWGCGRQRRQADRESSRLLLTLLGGGDEALQQQASKAEEGLLPATSQAQSVRCCSDVMHNMM